MIMTARLLSPTTSRKVTEKQPDDFFPGERDVIIGQGKKYYHHAGNAWFRKLVSSMLSEYRAANSKASKSLIITDVVDLVRQTGHFVKKNPEGQGWITADDLLCRERSSQTFRDALHESYRSSNFAKKEKRRKKNELKRQMDDAQGMTLANSYYPPAQKRQRPLNTHSSNFPSLGVAPTMSDSHVVSVLSTNFPVLEEGNPFEPVPLLEYPLLFNDDCPDFDDQPIALMQV